MSILEHHFSPIVAEKYGVNAAIFLRDIYHWCDTNRNNDAHFFEGRWWTHQTVKGLCRRHIYWTRNQVEHIIKTCKEKGALLSGHFSDDQLDRTSWYALTDEAWALFEGKESIPEISEMDSGKNTPIVRKFPKCNNDKYKTKYNQSPVSPYEQNSDLTGFYCFWKAYPKKKNKDRARTAWKKLKPDEALCQVIAAALERDKNSPDWQREEGRFIPYPATWLNDHRWEDEPDDPPAPAASPAEPIRGEGVRYQ